MGSVLSSNYYCISITVWQYSVVASSKRATISYVRLVLFLPNDLFQYFFLTDDRMHSEGVSRDPAGWPSESVKDLRSIGGP